MFGNKRGSGDDTVRNYVESFFKSIRYSRDSAQSKEDIIAVLEPVYESMKN